MSDARRARAERRAALASRVAQTAPVGGRPRRSLKEICPRGNNKVIIYFLIYHDKCLLFMLELY